MAKKTKKVKATRDTRTGRFVKAGTEDRRPSTTVRETINRDREWSELQVGKNDPNREPE